MLQGGFLPGSWPVGTNHSQQWPFDRSDQLSRFAEKRNKSCPNRAIGTCDISFLAIIPKLEIVSRIVMVQKFVQISNQGLRDPEKNLNLAAMTAMAHPLAMTKRQAEMLVKLGAPLIVPGSYWNCDFEQSERQE